MSRSVRHSVRIRLAAAAAFACLATAGAQAHSRSAQTSSPPLDDTTVRARADALIAQMTPTEKAGQLSQYFYFGGFSPAVAASTDAQIAAGQIGSLLFVSDPAQTNHLQKMAVERSRLKIPLLFGFDVIHGFRTIFPVPIALAASWDPAMIEQVQSVAANEARSVGVNWAFAPMLDIARDPRWGRMVEGAGEDPYLGSAVAAAQVRGFQGQYIGAPGHIIAGPKHFAGYGASLGGRDYDEANISEAELWNVYLPPFKAAIDAGAGNIMSAYMPLNGVPAAANHWLLTHVLRDTWGFKGFVVSDSAAVQSLVTQGLAPDLEDAAVRALKAGLDMEMSQPMQVAAMTNLPKALSEGRITSAQLDDAVRRVLEAKIRMGLFEHPYVDEAAATKVLTDPAHLALAERAAERTAVLLRNEGGLLPLDRKRLHSIAVLGPLADSARDAVGPWVFLENTPAMSSVLAGIKAKVGPGVRIDTSPGVIMPSRVYPSPFANMEKMFAKPAAASPPIDEKVEIKRAVAMATNADVTVLVLGEGQDMIGENASRSTFDLPGNQQQLLDAVVATGKPVVLLLMSARPLDLKESKAAAIMDIWYPGSAAGAAVANLVFGDATPGGKLPFTWIRSASQSPNPYSHLLSFAPLADTRYWNGSSAPVYPFGYGLSYTTFQYRNLIFDKAVYAPGEPVHASVDLKNTGTRPGEEVAQLYIHQRYGSSSRPVRELKGFQRIGLKPGETQTLHFTLTADDLRYWSAATGGWIADESPFDVWVGGSEEAELAGSFTVHKP